MSEDASDVRTSENTSVLGSLLNNASLMALLTAAIYYLGWVYWKSFYSYFGVGIDFVDTGFSTILSKSWEGMLIVLLNLYMYLVMHDENAKALDAGRIESVSLSIYVVVMTPLIVLVQPLVTDNRTASMIFWIFILIVTALSIMWPTFDRRLRQWIPVGRLAKSQSRFAFYMLLVMVILMAFQWALAQRDARRLMQKSGTLALSIREPQMSVTGLVLIAHSNDKYIVCRKSDTNTPPAVMIMHDGEIAKATIGRWE